VKQRFRTAIKTAKSLPPDNVRGYVNSWPVIWSSSPTIKQPTPAEVEAMLETIRWITWIELPDDRRFLWAYLDRRYPEHVEIPNRRGASAATISRYCGTLIQIIVDRLNQLE